MLLTGGSSQSPNLRHFFGSGVGTAGELAEKGPEASSSWQS